MKKSYKTIIAIIGSILLLAWFAVSCQMVKTATPVTPLQRIAAIDGTIQAIGQSTIDAYNAGKLTQADVKYVYAGLSTAANLTDNAQKAYEAGNVDNTNLYIQEALTLLENIQNFINTGGKTK